jgi:Zn finger protein HypA/HybF involved in hydrogenase expression
MEQREAPCAHCKKIVQYPAADVGMPFTCPHCHLTFDLPDGRAARPRAPGQLKSMCPKCSNVIDYLEEVAGQIIPCPTCGTRMKLPAPAAAKNPMLELADEKEEEKKPKAKGGAGGVIRGKKGFGRAVAPLSGPRMYVKEKDPHRSRLLIQATVLVIVAIVLSVGGYFAFRKVKSSKIDTEGKIKPTVEEYFQLLDQQNAAAAAQMHSVDDALKQNLVKMFQESFDKFDSHIATYSIKAAAIMSDGEALATCDVTFIARDKAKNLPAKRWTESLELRLQWQGGRWKILRGLQMPRSIPDQ